MTSYDSSETYVTLSVRGTKFTMLDPSNTIEAETFSDSGYEPAVVSILDELSKRYPVAAFFDIGALHGYYSALVSSRYWNWRVAAFEPNPKAYGVLVKNFNSLNIAGSAYALAINDTGESLYFRGRSIVGQTTDDAIIVSGVRFDDLEVMPTHVPKIVKIDVHGAEGLVLSGMTDSLKKDIVAVLVEVHAEHLLIGKYGYADILDMLEQAGLTAYEVMNFRQMPEIKLQKLVNKNRNQFVDYELWTEEQVKRERLVFAVKEED